MKIELNNKIALVTGRARGLGKAIVTKLENSGAIVCFTSRDKNEIDKFQTNQQQNILPIHADISTSKGIETAYQIITNKYSKLDILVNNIGHTLEIKDPYASKDDWLKVMNLNFNHN